MTDLFSLQGKTAVVIGGGGVLGGEMAHALASARANVVVAGASRKKAERRAEEIRALAGHAIACQTDATDKAALIQVLESAVSNFGSVDILINAAGVNSGTPFFEIAESEWNRLLDVNLRSVFLACQVFGKHMIEAGKGGSIINISSASSEPPLSQVFTYSIAKGGVNQITKYLAREWAPQRVRVNAILPGFFPAEQNRALLTDDRVSSILKHTPMERFGEPAELRGAVLFLASEKASSFVTGTILRVDGGFGAMTI